MKHGLTRIACSGLIALGFAFVGAPANANTLGIAGSATSGAVERSAVETPVTQVNHRNHRKWRHHKQRRHWNRHRPRAGFYLEFGRPAPYYYRPGYVRPRPARPYYGQPVRLSRAHVRWCYNRYRSYRASDNTFQPYHGPRRSCRSPYYR